MDCLRRLALLAASFVASVPGFAATASWFDAGAHNVTTFAVTADSGVIIAKRSGALAQRSTDRGRTWEPVPDLGTDNFTLTASPKDPQLLYAFKGRSSHTIDSWDSEVRRSGDGGKTWELVTSQARSPTSGGFDRLLPGADPGLVYAEIVAPGLCFTGLCVYWQVGWARSLNHGLTWEPMEVPKPSILKPSPADARTLFATKDVQLHRSDDGGVSWRLVHTFDSALDIVLDGVDPRTLYAHSGYSTGIRVSEDGGVTWRLAEVGPVSGYGRTVLADPLEAGRAYMVGGTGEVFATPDRGRSWSRVAPNSNLLDVARGLERRTMSDLPVIVSHGAGRFFLLLTGHPGDVRDLHAIDLPANPFFIGSDLWWNPAESGMGMSLTHSPSGQLFGLWYLYDSDGKATWYSIPGGQWSDDRTFTGVLYQNTGPPPASSKRVGIVTLKFDDDSHASFTYRFDTGLEGQKRLSRMLYGPRGEMYSYFTPADLWWQPAWPGWGLSVNQQYGTRFVMWFTYDGGRPTWYSMSGDGTLYSAEGPKAGEPYDPSKVTLTNVGRMTFTPGENSTFFFELRGATGQVTVSRFRF